jgi:iron complex outermembrane receptor protein
MGFKAERWELLDSYLLHNWEDNTTVVRLKEPLVPKSTEYNTAGFLQVQHKMNSVLTLNLGARYDYFEGFGGSFNPRVAVIVIPASAFTLKAIYGKSFQAPSYFYREANPGLGYGSTTQLEPEKMKVFQIAARVSPTPRWFMEISYFYNHLMDLISRDNRPDPDVYRNFGEMTAQGVEVEAKFHSKKLSGYANYTYLVPVAGKVDEALVKEKTFVNIPVHTANVGMTYRPLPSLSTRMDFNWTGNIYSAIPADPDNSLTSKVITDFAVLFKDKADRFNFTVSIHNLFDVEYKLGGTVPPYPQQGRWILAGIGYRFD